MNQIRFCSFFVLVLFNAGLIRAVGEETEASKKKEPELERITVSVHVTDESGNSIPNASVIPRAFRTKVERGSHYGWNPNAHGEQAKGTTDENGKASVQIPKYVYEKLEIGEVTWFVDHYDFVVYNADHFVDEAPAKIVLKSGYRIAATAVDAETGEKISDHLHAVLIGESFSSDWKLKSGILVSRAFDVERSNLRLTYLPEDKPAMFSELMVVERPGDSDRAFLKQVKMKTGTQVTGTLDASVPRPIKNGEIVAQVSELKGPGKASYRTVWTWNDKIKIEEDGTFIFDSLPSGGILQIIAKCDGWVSKDPTQAEIDKVIPWDTQISPSFSGIPQVFKLDQPKISCSIKMEKSSTCNFTIYNDKEEPLANATVGMWPNHYWLAGGSTLFGFGYRTAALLQGVLPENVMLANKSFTGKTDENGNVTIANLPNGPNIGYAVMHDEFDMPITGRRRSGRVHLEPGKAEKIEVHMQPKGKDALGE